MPEFVSVVFHGQVLDYVGLTKPYVGHNISCVEFIISYVGYNITCVGIIIYHVGNNIF